MSCSILHWKSVVSKYTIWGISFQTQGSVHYPYRWTLLLYTGLWRLEFSTFNKTMYWYAPLCPCSLGKGKRSARAGSAYVKGRCWLQRRPILPLPGSGDGDFCFLLCSFRNVALKINVGQCLHCSWPYSFFFWRSRCLSFTVWSQNFWKWKIHLVIFQKYYYIILICDRLWFLLTFASPNGIEIVCLQ